MELEKLLSQEASRFLRNKPDKRSIGTGCVTTPVESVKLTVGGYTLDVCIGINGDLMIEVDRGQDESVEISIDRTLAAQSQWEIPMLEDMVCEQLLLIADLPRAAEALRKERPETEALVTELRENRHAALHILRSLQGFWNNGGQWRFRDQIRSPENIPHQVAVAAIEKLLLLNPAPQPPPDPEVVAAAKAVCGL